MGKKKPFIDRKKSSTYHLLYRSQRDTAGVIDDDGEDGGGGAETVLWPSPHNNVETDRKVLLGSNVATQLRDDKLQEWKKELSEAGLVDDYDYEKHMKPVTGTGQLLTSKTTTATHGSEKAVGAMLDARAMTIQDEIVKEVDRQLDSIALTAECMDEEIAQALFGDFDDCDFEELNDEFVLDAAKETLDTDGDDDNGNNVGDTFDFAAHIRSLVEKAKMDSQSGDTAGGLATIHEQGRADKDFFSRAIPVGKTSGDIGDYQVGQDGRYREHGRDDAHDDDSGYFDENDPFLDDFMVEGTPGVVASLTEAEEKALCDKFNATLAEYDSDDLGEGQDEDDVYGTRPLEGDAQVEAALDDFLQEKKDEIFMQGDCRYPNGKKKNGGSGFSALVGTKMVPMKDLADAEAKLSMYNRGDIQPVEDILGEADEALAGPRAAPPAEEIFIDGKSYYSEKIRNPWDCESILSTYSNLDNNPVEIGGDTGRRRRKAKSKQKKHSVSDDADQLNVDPSHQLIRLSEKTGLPLGVLGEKDNECDDGYDDDDYGAEDTYISVNKGEARRKNESIEEKKLRKVTVKKERQLARMQKKMMKEAFQDEFAKRQHELEQDDVGGRTVFRF